MHEPEPLSNEEQNRRERRKLFVHALVGVPVIITIMAKPAWAQTTTVTGANNSVTGRATTTG
jgi:hypothetical protein